MRTSRTLSISLPPAQLRESMRLARKENRTMSELVREALRRYQQAQDFALNSPLAMAMAGLQAEALARGSHKLSKREIDREIAAARRERRKGRPTAP